MSVPIKYPSFRKWCLPVISGLAMILAAAAFDPDQNWVRLAWIADRAPSQAGREPQEIRPPLHEVDNKIRCASSIEKSTRFRASLAAHYLAVLARYHNWLNQLPETKQDELEAPSARLSEWRR